MTTSVTSLRRYLTLIRDDYNLIDNAATNYLSAMFFISSRIMEEMSSAEYNTSLFPFLPPIIFVGLANEDPIRKTIPE